MQTFFFFFCDRVAFHLVLSSGVEELPTNPQPLLPELLLEAEEGEDIE